MAIEDRIASLFPTSSPSFERQEPFNDPEERRNFEPSDDIFGAVLPRDIPRDQLPGLRPPRPPLEVSQEVSDKIRDALENPIRVGSPDAIGGIINRLTPEQEARFFSDPTFQEDILRSNLPPVQEDITQDFIDSIELKESDSTAKEAVANAPKASFGIRNKLPTLSNYIAGRAVDKFQAPNNLNPITSKVQSAIDPHQAFIRKFKDLGKVSPGDAAYKGSMFGGAVGLDVGGPTGALVGAGLGSALARGMADVQSGRAEANKKRTRASEIMAKLGIASAEGVISFDDEKVDFRISPDEAVRIKNQGALARTGADRATFEIDKTNVFANRASKMARSMALFLNNGVLNYSDLKNPANLQTLDNITGYLVNAATADVRDITTVKKRLKDIMSKMKLDETKLRTFLETIKGELPEEEALAIKEGLEMLFS